MNNVTNKKILVFAPLYFGYERLIVEELEKKGARVTFLENKPFIHDLDNRGSNWFLKFFSKKKVYVKYCLLPISKTYFDFLFVVDLFSFDEELFFNLKKANPNLKSILYMWDNIRGYRWERWFKYFDHVCSFDPVEADEFNIEYFPNFFPNHGNKAGTPTLDLCSICSFQVHRLNILESAQKEMEKQEKKVFFYIYLPPLQTKVIYNKFFYWMSKLFRQKFKGYRYLYRLFSGDLSHPLVKREPLSLTECVYLIADSKCILDLPFPDQTGSTQRVINALGLGKKVITTNKSVVKEMFYNEEYIKVISSVNEIDWSWIERESNQKMNLDFLRIDHWLDHFFEPRSK